MKRREFVVGSTVVAGVAALPGVGLARQPMAAPFPGRLLLMIDDGRMWPEGEASVLRGSPIVIPGHELAIHGENTPWCALRPLSEESCHELRPLSEESCHELRPLSEESCHELVPFGGDEMEMVIRSHDKLLWRDSQGTLTYDAGRAATSVSNYNVAETALRDWDEDFHRASETWPDGFVQVILVSRRALAADVLSWGSYILVNGAVDTRGTEGVYAGAVDDPTWMKTVIDQERALAKERWAV